MSVDLFASEQARHRRDAPRKREAVPPRYGGLISSLPLPAWELDVRAVRRILKLLRAAGVTDLDAYTARHPEWVEMACDVIRVTEANRDAAELFGAADPSKLVGPIRYLFARASPTPRRLALAHVAGQRNHVEQIKIQRFDGQVRDVLLLVTFPAPGEPLDTTLIMMIDNTARLEAEARLRQIEADFTHAARLSTLGQMTASIAHEIKQPLSAILTNAETSLRWLAKADPNLPKVTQLAERVAASARRASDIIARTQDMAGKRQTMRVALDLNDVIGEALTFVRHDSEARSIRLQLDLSRGLPAVTADRVQLQQVVVNLLVNSNQALEAVAPEQREIRVATFREGPDAVGFSVADTGPGILPEDLERVFGGFFSTKEGGMGIGLTICRSIIAAHGGTITPRIPRGGGAEFRVVLSLDPSARASAPGRPNDDQPDHIPGSASP